MTTSYQLMSQMSAVIQTQQEEITRLSNLVEELRSESSQHGIINQDKDRGGPGA